MSDQALRYPIGGFEAPERVDRPRIDAWIDEIARLPRQLRPIVEPLDDEQLARPYRPGGWTVAQVVHHLADSHVNSYTRFRLALTETRPTIRPYDEGAWAELPDARDLRVGPSLDLLDALHARWTGLLRSLGDAEFERDFDHPESGIVTLGVNTGIYAWHGRHHLAHIGLALQRGESP